MNNVRVIINHFFQTAFLVLSCTRRHRPRRPRRRRRTYLSTVIFCYVQSPIRCSLFSRLTSSLSLSPPVVALSCNHQPTLLPFFLIAPNEYAASFPFHLQALGRPHS